MTETLIAERKFAVDSSRERLWQLIARVVFSSLSSVERMEIIDENNWQALLKVKLGFITLNMDLKGETIDTTPPEMIGVRLRATGMGGIAKLDQKVTIKLDPLDDARTEVTCRAVAYGMGSLFKLFLLGRARSFATETFDSIEKRLKYLA